MMDGMLIHAGSSDSVDQVVVEEAAARLLKVGWVVLRGVTDPRHISAVAKRMLADANRLLPYSTDHRVRAKGHIGQVPPLRPQLVFRDLVCNPTVDSICRTLFGGRAVLTHYTGHTLMPGAERQPVHLDLGHLWPNLTTSHPPYVIAVNTAVIDVDDSNGSMEVWDGSHLITAPPVRAEGSLILDDHVVETPHFRHIASRISLRSGDVLLRDMRLWHRGMENPSALPRPMMWSLMAAEWYRGGTRARLPTGARAKLAACEALATVDWVDDKIDYLLLDL